MAQYDARFDGISFDQILRALTQRSPTEETRTLRNRARFIAERALEQSLEGRDDFVNHKVWEN